MTILVVLEEISVNRARDAEDKGDM